MKYVGVKHEPEQTVTYWFEAPDNIARQISVGSSVICDTRRGSMSGIVEQIMDGIPQNIARSVIGDHFPLKKVLAVSKDIPIQDIRISWEIDSNPSPEEIAERVREYYNHGKFDSPIICDEDGNLEIERRIARVPVGGIVAQKDIRDRSQLFKTGKSPDDIFAFILKLRRFQQSPQGDESIAPPIQEPGVSCDNSAQFSPFHNEAAHGGNERI